MEGEEATEEAGAPIEVGEEGDDLIDQVPRNHRKQPSRLLPGRLWLIISTPLDWPSRLVITQ